MGTDTDSCPGHSRGFSSLCDRGFLRLDSDLDSRTSALVDRGHGHRAVDLFEILQWKLVA